MAQTWKVLLPANMPSLAREALAAHGGVTVESYPVDVPAERFHALLQDADGVALSVTPFGEGELRAAPRLRAVARNGVGYDNVDVAALTRRGIPLLVTGTANSPSVAEHALFLMLAIAKRGLPFDRMVRERRWGERYQRLPVDLLGKTVLIVGFGRIGSRLAPMVRALGMRVLVHDPYVDAAVVAAAGCEAAPVLDAALAVADFVSLHCPRTPETVGLMDARRLALMKPTAVLVNTARGGLIDEVALDAALRAGRLGGAGLDVLECEPPQAGLALLDAPDLVLAPHMAGVTREAFDRMALATANNLLQALAGQPDPAHVINREVLAARGHA